MSGAIWENAAGGLIAAEVHGVVGFLLSRMTAEIKLPLDLQEELENVKEQFEELSGILQGISNQPVPNPLMGNWLKKIKDVAEDVDIFLDECSYKALEDEIQTQVTQQWGSVVNTLIRSFDHLGIAHKVSKLKESIADIYKLADKLGIKLVKVAGGHVYSGKLAEEIEQQDKKLSEQRQCVDLRLFQGRGDDVQKLEDLLCDPTNSNSDLTIIGVVGLAGLGKTTLSKHISRVERVKSFFDSMVIWLVVSHNFDLMDILKKMFEKVIGKDSTMGRQALIDELETKMKGKKYLIILDDVWDTINWELLTSILWEIGVSQGTTLLVTSRDQKVIEKWHTTKTPTIYQLKGLSRDDSRILFKKKFQDKIEAGSKEEQIAETMIDRCGGVPLAIRLLADLLRGKKRIEDWREIEQSEIWIKEDEYGILPSLRLSYNYLPDTALKKCFAFCAIFEEDAVIEKQKLIYMWMAQGFLQPIDKMEPKGEEYIDDLLNRSLFQDAELDIYGNVNKFKMHDLVRSLARDVSKGECLCSYRVEDLEKVRHLLVPHYSESREFTLTSFKKLQTCMLSKEIENPSLHDWLKCERLRVLIIGTNWSEDTDWKPLGKLIHLRYFEINIKKDLQHFKLPHEITKLYHLQTLCINIPPLPGNPSKTIFPEEIGNLVKLRHILIKGSKCIGVPVGLSHLTALQTLPVINFGMDWDGRISDIGSLTNLRGQLVFQGCSKFLTVEKGRSLDLGSKSKLETLVIYWSCEDPDDTEKPDANEILKEMQPNANLRNLKVLWFYGTKFPRWLMGTDFTLNKIVYLHIQSCGAHGNLILENFIYLRRLEVSTCKKLTVTFTNSSSQCCKDLEYLEIIECKKVKQLPDLFLLPKLETIEIWGNKSTSRDVLVGLGSLENLKELETDLQLPVELGEDSPVCKSLEHIVLRGSTFPQALQTDLPEQLQHLVELQSLWICDFEMLEAIPDWLGKLTSLKSLYLGGMPKLKHLPPQHVMKALSNLKELDCQGCSQLKKDFENKTGEWDKIAHIPKIPGRYI